MAFLGTKRTGGSIHYGVIMGCFDRIERVATFTFGHLLYSNIALLKRLQLKLI